MTSDAIVVGGGVIGCSIALKLAEAGLKVTVIEKGRIGCEASRAAAGMLATQSEATQTGPFFDICLQSRSIYRDFAARLSEASGIDVEYKDEGMLFIALEDDTEGPDRATAWANWQNAAGLAVDKLNARETHALEPAVTESATRAVFIPGDHQIENRRLMDALDVAMQRAGVQVVEGAVVDRITVEQDRATGVECGGDRLNGGCVIVAAGTWSGSLLASVGLNVETIPAHGQIVALRGSRAPITRVIHSHKCYIVPRRDGRILIGATVEYLGFQKRITAGAISSLLSAGIEAVPGLKDFEIVESWSGLRPDTVDHLPIIGGCGIGNLYLATGHFRNGILLAPFTADVIATLVLSGRALENLKPFAASRFEQT
jgi:glycine oxidase